MTKRWSRTTLALSLLVVLLGAVPLLAQTQFASFTGTVVSKDGSPVPGVDVVATNVATQVKYTARSNDVGLYTISALPIGTYKLRVVQQTGFKLTTPSVGYFSITLSSGGISTGKLFGEKKPA